VKEDNQQKKEEKRQNSSQFLISNGSNNGFEFTLNSNNKEYKSINDSDNRQ